MILLILTVAAILGCCAYAAHRLDVWWAERERRRIVCDRLGRYGYTRGERR